MGKGKIPFGLACGVVLGLWVPYTAVNTVFPGPGATYVLGIACAGASVVALWLAGIEPAKAYLRIAPLSRLGAVLLGVQLLFVPGVIALGRVCFCGWRSVLLEAPASALGQEVYFRGAVLAVAQRLFAGHPWRAQATQAAMYAAWHARAFRETSFWPALAVIALALVGGVIWGRQVAHDRTLLYAWLQHWFFLAIQ